MGSFLMIQRIKSHFCLDERGHVAIEYALLISALGLVIAAAIQALGVSLGDLFNAVFNHLS